MPFSRMHWANRDSASKTASSSAERSNVLWVVVATGSDAAATVVVVLSTATVGSASPSSSLQAITASGSSSTTIGRCRVTASPHEHRCGPDGNSTRARRRSPHDDGKSDDGRGASGTSPFGPRKTLRHTPGW